MNSPEFANKINICIKYLHVILEKNIQNILKMP